MHTLICLMYHSIGRNNLHQRYAVSEGQFSEHLAFIKTHNLLSISTEAIERSSNGQLVHISFDDGALSDYETASVILEKHNLRSTFFIITNYIGNCGYMNWEHINELNKRGFDIQSHTHTHPLLGTLDIKEIKEELVISKDILEQKLGRRIQAISLPGGSMNSKVLETAVFCGYQYIFTSLPAVNIIGKTNIYHRILITQKITLDDFEKIVTGDYFFYRKKRFFYQLRQSAKGMIGPNRYQMLWRKFYKNKPQSCNFA